MSTVEGKLIRAGTFQVYGETICGVVVECGEAVLRSVPRLPMYRKVSVVESAPSTAGAAGPMLPEQPECGSPCAMCEAMAHLNSKLRAELAEAVSQRHFFCDENKRHVSEVARLAKLSSIQSAFMSLEQLARVGSEVVAQREAKP
jgi:hypothetical protein